MSTQPQPPSYSSQHNGGAPMVQTTNGFAIAALVVGLLGGSLIAVILGHVARKQIRERGQAGDGMAIAGLVLGYIGLAAVVLVLIFTIIAIGASSTLN